MPRSLPGPWTWTVSPWKVRATPPSGQLVISISLSLCVCVCVCAGDQVSRKGTLTGGYYDSRRSRLEIQRKIVELKERIESTQGEKEQLQQQIDDILECVCVCVGSLFVRFLFCPLFSFLLPIVVICSHKFGYNINPLRGLMFPPSLPFVGNTMEIVFLC